MRYFDLSYAYLKNVSLSNFNLSNIDLSNTNLHSADLRGANLSNTNLSGADLQEATLIKANLEGADLSNADLRYANIQGTNLTNIKKEGTKFYESESCPWCDIDARQFEELCYDIINKKHNPTEISLMGKLNSRDGGRDIVFLKSVSSEKHCVKWIVQCKLIRNGASLTAKKVQNIRDMLADYKADGFCVMTNSVIDATLHDRLDRVHEKDGIKIERWSGLEIERFLAEHPEIRARYFIH